MSKETIEKNLKNALLNDGTFARELFEYELEGHIGYCLLSKQTDADKYYFAVTENTNDVAMLLIDDHENIHINEDARTLLKKLWGGAYRKNMEVLIPQMAEELDEGYLFSAGVKVSGEV